MVYVPKKLLHILVDRDGVLADLNKGFCDNWKAEYQSLPSFEPEQITTFFPREFFVEQLGDVAKELSNNIAYKQGFVRNLPPIEGAIEGYKKLQSLGHKLTICTSPLKSEYASSEIREWVEFYLGRDVAESTLITGEDGNPKEKELYDGDILIDDKNPSKFKLLDQAKWDLITFIRDPYNTQYLSENPTLKQMTWTMDFESVINNVVRK